MFPETSFPAFESFSYGAMTVTPDGLPRLFDIGPNALAISGCNGFGLTLGCIAAREAARSFSGANADDIALSISKLSKLRGRKAMPWIIRHIVAPLANRLGA
jgi:glycine/D-amino acid oxidase-like deaminating enzyme